MKRSTSRWTTAMAAAALIALPAAGYAQTPASPQPQPQNPAAQTSAPQTSQNSASGPAEHVRAAKQALSSIQTTTLPASARPKIAQLHTRLNNLEREIAKGSSASATKSAGAASWGTDVAAIDKIITDLVGPDTGAAPSSGATASGAAGTTGRNTATIDDATKAQLREVRKHVTELAASMSGTAPKSDASASASSPSAAAPAAAEATPSAPTASATPTTDPAAAPAASANQQTTPASTQPGAQSAQVDRDAAKQHLSEARESLSQLAALPEAGKLQGETRNQVSQLIANFNELITTQSDWKAAYAKLDATLSALLGPNAGAAAAPAAEPAATGTTGATSAPAAAAGTTGAAGTLDPAIRAKLEEFRTHIKAFEQAAGGAPSGAQNNAAMSPSVSTGSASSPANPGPGANPTAPASAASPAPTAPASTPEPTPSATPAAPAQTPAQSTPAAPSATSGTPGATGTSGSMSPAPTDAATPAASTTDADKHLDAITEILSKAKNGKLDKEQTDQIKMHVDQLRQLLKK